MCGLFAYAGSDSQAIAKVLGGLKDLEYRGYDSWGIAVKQNPSLYMKKSVGKVSDAKLRHFENKKGKYVIGHTRWATHGGVSQKNAHPHFNRDKTIAVVHNGIIENYQELQGEIRRAFGERVFRSETDTEVIPLLLDLYLSRGASLERAFLRVCKRLKGRFAFVVLARDADFLLAARNGSPLVIGKGNGEYFAASDVPAFLEYTRTVNSLNDGEWARFSDNRDKKAINRKPADKCPEKPEEKAVYHKREKSKGKKVNRQGQKY